MYLLKKPVFSAVMTLVAVFSVDQQANSTSVVRVAEVAREARVARVVRVAEVAGAVRAMKVLV